MLNNFFNKAESTDIIVDKNTKTIFIPVPKQQDDFVILREFEKPEEDDIQTDIDVTINNEDNIKYLKRQ